MKENTVFEDMIEYDTEYDKKYCPIRGGVYGCDEGLCALYSVEYGKCAHLLQAEATARSAAMLEKIADSTEERILGF